LIIIAGFAGIGKTTISKNNPNVVDLESSKYKWILKKKYINSEEAKGLTSRDANPDWPDNYIREIFKAITDNKEIILIAPIEEVLHILDQCIIEYILVFPALEIKEEMLQRYRDRNNSQDFLDKMNNNYDEIVRSLLALPQKKYILQSGQYLSDIMLEIKKNKFNV